MRFAPASPSHNRPWALRSWLLTPLNLLNNTYEHKKQLADLISLGMSTHGIYTSRLRSARINRASRSRGRSPDLDNMMFQGDHLWDQRVAGPERQSLLARLPTKRRRTICDDDDEDDIEIVEKPGYRKKAIDLTTPFTEHVETPSGDGEGPLFAVITIKTRGGRVIRTLEDVTVVRQISQYAKKLDKTTSRRVEIIDDCQRDEETVLQMLEFCHSGSLPSLTTGRSHLLSSQLRERVKLYDLSLALGVPGLETAVIAQIRGCSGMDAEISADFARYCYLPSHDHVNPQCTLGVLVKQLLRTHLTAMGQSGAANLIQEEGGPLAGQLHSILMEKYLASGMEGSGEVEQGHHEARTQSGGYSEELQEDQKHVFSLSRCLISQRIWTAYALNRCSAVHESGCSSRIA